MSIPIAAGAAFMSARGPFEKALSRAPAAGRAADDPASDGTGAAPSDATNAGAGKERWSHAGTGAAANSNSEKDVRGAAGSATATAPPVVRDDGAVKRFVDALRIHVARDEAGPATGPEAPAPASASLSPASASSAALASGHVDALWQRLFAGQFAKGAASRPVKIPAEDGDSGDDTGTLLPATVAATSAIAAAAVAAAGTLSVASPPSASLGLAAAPVRSTAARRDAPVLAPPAVAADGPGAADESGAADGPSAAGNATPSEASAVTRYARIAIADTPGDGAAGHTGSSSGPSISTAPPSMPAAANSVAGAGPDPTQSAVVPRPASGATLVQALGERLQVQIARGSENAVIRLDPPSMGNIDIVIRHEAGIVQVHLSASNSDVLNQLQGIGDALRQDLIQRHQGTVSVQVSDGARDEHGRQRQAGDTPEEPGRALHEAGEEPGRFTLTGNGNAS